MLQQLQDTQPNITVSSILKEIYWNILRYTGIYQNKLLCVKCNNDKVIDDPNKLYRPVSVIHCNYFYKKKIILDVLHPPFAICRAGIA
jgi:hypothetical protein